MVMFLVLHPMESISLNSFVLLEHLAMLLTHPETNDLKFDLCIHSIFISYDCHSTMPLVPVSDGCADSKYNKRKNRFEGNI